MSAAPHTMYEDIPTATLAADALNKSGDFPRELGKRLSALLEDRADFLAALRGMLEPFVSLPDSVIAQNLARGSFSFGGINSFQLKRIAAARAALAKAESRVG